MKSWINYDKKLKVALVKMSNTPYGNYWLETYNWNEDTNTFSKWSNYFDRKILTYKETLYAIKRFEAKGFIQIID